MSTTLPGPFPTAMPFVPQIGQSITYVLRREEQLQYGVQTASAGVANVRTPSCVDLQVTLGGKVLTLLNVTYDANATPGNWHY